MRFLTEQAKRESEATVRLRNAHRAHHRSLLSGNNQEAAAAEYQAAVQEMTDARAMERVYKCAWCGVEFGATTSRGNYGIASEVHFDETGRPEPVIEHGGRLNLAACANCDPKVQAYLGER